MEKNIDINNNISFEKLNEWSKLKDNQCINFDCDNRDYNLFHRIENLKSFNNHKLELSTIS